MENKNLLSQNQEAFLQKLRGSKYFTDKFYLTGGTALAAFYLFHRYSEGLDFFSENEFDIIEIDVFIKKLATVLEEKFGMRVRTCENCKWFESDLPMTGQYRFSRKGFCAKNKELRRLGVSVVSSGFTCMGGNRLEVAGVVVENAWEPKGL